MMISHSHSHRRAQAAVAKEDELTVSIKVVNWRRLAGCLQPYWRRMALAILALLLSSGFGLAFPLVIVRLLDSVTKARDSGPLDTLALLLPALVHRRAHRL